MGNPALPELQRVCRPQQPGSVAALLAAAHFAAIKHRRQRRKNTEADPYINHPVAVADLLARCGEVTDLTVLQAALLHDTIEDTETTAGEIERLFGPEVSAVVQEVTDDKTLRRSERKRLQVQHAPHLSPGAKLIKLADKICNLRELNAQDPAGWTRERKLEYIDWGEKVVAGLRGCHRELEQLFDQTVQERRTILSKTQ